MKNNPKAEIAEIDILPNEILVNIFSYLNYKELSSAVLVSKLWKSQSKQLRLKSKFEIQQQHAYKFIETIFFGTKTILLQEITKDTKIDKKPKYKKKYIREKILQLLSEFYDLNQEWKKINVKRDRGMEM